MNKFRMVDLSEIKFFLGIKVDKSEGHISLSQSVYIKSILLKYNMENCNPVNCPLPTKLNHIALSSDYKCDAPCRNVIGWLMYIMLCTRPDLSTAVNFLSRYCEKNNTELWQCLKKVLRYLKVTVDLKLSFQKNSNFNEFLVGYVDSDWGGSELDRKSTTGYIFKMFDSNVICWNTRKQNSVAASSTEAEYMALFEAVREAKWLNSLLASLKIKVINPIRLYEDNQGCISIANNPSCHKRSKHIDIKYHFTREQVDKNLIEVVYIPTGKQIADMLPKPLPAQRFCDLRDQINLIN